MLMDILLKVGRRHPREEQGGRRVPENPRRVTGIQAAARGHGRQRTRVPARSRTALRR